MKQYFSTPSVTGGFTLTELLVTIGIISVVVALLFPATASIKDSAGTAKCISNIRGVGVAITTYAGENGGRYPTFGQDLNGPNAQPYWGEKIEPYLGRHSKIYLCPSERSKWATPDDNEKQPASLGFTYPGAWYAGISYGANPAIVSLTIAPDGTYPQRSVGTIPRPSATVLLTDSWDNSRATEIGTCLVTGHPNEPSYLNPLGMPRSNIKFRHGKKANVCFADGHVGTLTEKQLMPNASLPKDDPDYSLWDFN